MTVRKYVAARALLAALPLVAFCTSRPAQGYIDLAPSLTKIIGDAPTICEVEVTAYNPATHILTLRPVQALKGTLPAGTVQHEISPSATALPAPTVAQWATPGARAVMFASNTTALVCVGTAWYQVRTTRPTSGEPWKLGQDRPDLPLAYYGNVSRLVDGVEAIVAGKPAVITAVAFGADNEGASFDLALNRQSLPGIVRVQRIRATPGSPGTVMSATTGAAYFIGVGVADMGDLPDLLGRLGSKDVTVRAEAAADIGTLKGQAKSAAPVLMGLLKDASPRVRYAAASAVLQVTPKDAGNVRAAIEVLNTGLADKDAPTRRAATSAAGFGGAAAEPLTEKLAGLLKDSDHEVRVSALQSISMLGTAASKALPAVIPVLDNPELTIDAADALGRMGEAARPAMKRLALLLDSDQYAVRWAAVRAMAQIGGPDAPPAVEFMIKQMPTANEVEGYNMMIYFSLLGPDAAYAASTITSFRVKNPVLPSSTAWALAPEKSLPWQNGGGFGGRGGRGGGGGGGGGANLNVLMYEAYVHELGTRLRPVAPILAKKIMDGTASDVPDYGYRILAAGPDLALEILTPNLAASDLATREKATVAIGYMGEAGAPAKSAVEATLKKATDEREKMLLAWCLRQIDPE